MLNDIPISSRGKQLYKHLFLSVGLSVTLLGNDIFSSFYSNFIKVAQNNCLVWWNNIFSLNVTCQIWWSYRAKHLVKQIKFEDSGHSQKDTYKKWSQLNLACWCILTTLRSDSILVRSNLSIPGIRRRTHIKNGLNWIWHVDVSWPPWEVIRFCSRCLAFLHFGGIFTLWNRWTFEFPGFVGEPMRELIWNFRCWWVVTTFRTD